MKREKVYFYNNHDEKLIGVLSRKYDFSDICVIVCHGFKGNKDRPLIRKIYNSFVSKWSVFRFDFAGNGESEGDIGEASYIKEVEDLKCAIEFLYSKGFRRFCLVGHSMGAGVCVLTAAECNRVRWLVSISAYAHPEKWKEEKFKEENIREAFEQGTTKVRVSSKRIINLNRNFFLGLEKADIIKSSKRLKIPIIVIHGKKDRSVGVDESKDLFVAANNPKTIQLISNANHNFQNKESMEKMVNAVIDWAKKWVKK